MPKLKEAQEAAREAKERLALERRRAEKVAVELRALEEQLQVADPDDAKAFDRLVAAQGAAKARAAVLQGRVTEAEGAVAATDQVLAAATREAAKVDLAELAGRQRADSDAIVALTKDFAEQLGARLQSHHDVARCENTLALERAAGERMPHTLADRLVADDVARAVASILSVLRDEAANAAWLASDGPQRQEEEARRQQERSEERLREETFEGNVERMPRHVRATVIGGSADAC